MQSPSLVEFITSAVIIGFATTRIAPTSYFRSGVSPVFSIYTYQKSNFLRDSHDSQLAKNEQIRQILSCPMAKLRSRFCFSQPRFPYFRQRTKNSHHPRACILPHCSVLQSNHPPLLELFSTEHDANSWAPFRRSVGLLVPAANRWLLS